MSEPDWSQISVDHMMEIGHWYGFAMWLMPPGTTWPEVTAKFFQYEHESRARDRSRGVAPNDAEDARRKAIREKYFNFMTGENRPYA